MKISGVYINSLLFSLFLFALSCRDKVPVNNSIYNGGIKSISNQWHIKNSIPLPNSVVIKFISNYDKYSFWSSTRDLIFFNGKESQIVFSSFKDRIGDVAISGDHSYLILGLHSEEYTIKLFYIPFTIINGQFRLGEKLEIENLVTENIIGIKCIGNDKFILLGTMEYQIITVQRKEIVSFINEHHTIELNPGFGIQLVNTTGKSEVLLNSLDDIYKLDATDNYSTLKKIIEFPNPQLKPEEIKYAYRSILYRCTGNLDRGIFKKDSLLCYYKKINNSYSFESCDTILVNNKIKVSPKDIFYFQIADNNFVYAAGYGTIICKDLSDNKPLNQNWSTVINLNKPQVYSYVYSNGEIIAALDSIYIIQEKKITDDDKELMNRSKTNFFILGDFPISSSIYGIAISDLNGDKKEDVYTIDIYDNNRFFNNFINFEDPYLSNTTEKIGLGGRKNKEGVFDLDLGVVAGDIDESGSDDLIVTYLEGPNALYINNNRGYFRECTEEFGLNVNIHRSESASLGDINNDGYLDYFTTSYLFTNRLFINIDGRKFSERTVESGLKSEYGAITAVMGDVNNDGYLDIYLCNWQKENNLYLNNRDGTFKDITQESGTDCGKMKRSNSAIFADFDNDGDLDLFIGNRGTGNNLFLNNGKGIFSNVTSESGLAGKYFTYGAVAADFNNDSFLDLAFTNIKNIVIYFNKGIKGGVPQFERFTEPFLNQLHNSEATGSLSSIASLDIKNDGDIDLLIGQVDGKLQLLHNNLNINSKSNNFISVKVIGSESNRSAIGTKLFLYDRDKLVGFREINSNSGYASSGSKIQHFGLGKGLGTYKLVALFPKSNVRKELFVRAGSHYEIHEHNGLSEIYFILFKNLKRYLLSNEFFFEIIKLLFIIPLFYLFVFLFKNSFIQTRFPFFSTVNKKQLFNLGIICLGSYLFTIISVRVIYYIYPSNSDWINNSRNVFINDYLAFLVSLASIPISLILIKNNESKKLSRINILDKLLKELQGFYHGEASAMNLNRLSLYLKNFNTIDFEDTIVLERFKSIIDEYNESTYKSLIIISDFANLLRFDKRFLNEETTLKKVSYGIALYIEEIRMALSLINLESIEKKKDYCIEQIEKLKQEIVKLVRIIHSIVNCNLDEVLEIINNKFSDSQKEHYRLEINNRTEHFTKLFIDKNELEKCISIMIQNSIEAYIDCISNDNLIELNIEEKQGHIILSIKDYATGIKEENLNNIFQKGFTTKANGQGFGLAYVKEITTKYYGTVFIESIPGEGTTVNINLKTL